MTNQEVIQARAIELHESLKHFAKKVPWSWVREHICGQYTLGVLQRTVEKNNMKAEKSRYAVESQLFKIWTLM